MPNVPRSRVKVTQTSGLTTIRMGVPRSLGMIAFLLFWMIGWAGGEVASIRTLASGGIRPTAYGFAAAWLVLWTAGGLAGVLGLLWAFAGHDLVTVDGSTLTLRRAAGPIGRTQTFPLAEVTNLRYLPPPTRGAPASPGGLAFEHHGRTVQFGIHLGPADGRAVRDALAPALPAATAS